MTDRSARPDHVPELGARNVESWNVDRVTQPAVRQRIARPGTVDDHESLVRFELVGPMPRVEPGGGVGTDDHRPFHVWLVGPEPFEGDDGVARSADLQLDIGGLEARSICDRGRNHLVPPVGIGDDSAPHLLPRAVAHHEANLVEPEPIADLIRHHEMANMRWVEGAAEEADPATHERSFGRTVVCCKKNHANVTDVTSQNGLFILKQVFGPVVLQTCPDIFNSDTDNIRTQPRQRRKNNEHTGPRR